MNEFPKKPPYALVVGGTKGLGGAISGALRRRGFSVITISRNPDSPPYHFVCDVTGELAYYRTIEEISKRYPVIEIVVCSYGSACPTSEKAGGEMSDLKYSFSHNYGYVLDTSLHLATNLQRSENPQFITIGTRWMYKNKDALRNYIAAKRLLAAEIHYHVVTREKGSRICWNMWNVPPMDNEGYRKAHGIMPGAPLPEPLADPTRIGETLVKNALECTLPSAFIYGITEEGVAGTRPLPFEVFWVDTGLEEAEETEVEDLPWFRTCELNLTHENPNSVRGTIRNGCLIYFFDEGRGGILCHSY